MDTLTKTIQNVTCLGFQSSVSDLTDQFKEQYPKIEQAAVSTLLRVKGWILPNYPLPPTEEKTEILRVVVRESFSSSSSIALQVRR